MTDLEHNRFSDLVSSIVKVIDQKIATDNGIDGNLTIMALASILGGTMGGVAVLKRRQYGVSFEETFTKLKTFVSKTIDTTSASMEKREKIWLTNPLIYLLDFKNRKKIPQDKFDFLYDNNLITDNGLTEVGEFTLEQWGQL